MHEQHAIAFDGMGQAGQELPLLRGQSLARPDRGLAGRRVHVGTESRQCGLVVIAAHDDGAVLGMAAHDLQAGVGIGAIAHQVAQKGIGLSPQALGVGQAGGQGLVIGVNVGQDGEFHDA